MLWLLMHGTRHVTAVTAATSVRHVCSISTVSRSLPRRTRRLALLHTRASQSTSSQRCCSISSSKRRCSDVWARCCSSMTRSCCCNQHVLHTPHDCCHATREAACVPVHAGLF